MSKPSKAGRLERETKVWWYSAGDMATVQTTEKHVQTRLEKLGFLAHGVLSTAGSNGVADTSTPIARVKGDVGKVYSVPKAYIHIFAPRKRKGNPNMEQVRAGKRKSVLSGAVQPLATAM